MSQHSKLTTELIHSFELGILAHAVTEGEQGLWEPLWEANTLYPAMSSEARVALSRRVLEALHSKGWIGFYRLSWSDREAGKKPVELTPSEVAEALNDTWWTVVPLPRTDIWFDRTDAGERAYEALPRNAE